MGEAGWNPPVEDGGGDGHAERGQGPELAASGGVGIDAGEDDGAHASKMAAQCAGSKGRDSG
jgi:hypothetical protein